MDFHIVGFTDMRTGVVRIGSFDLARTYGEEITISENTKPVERREVLIPLTPATGLFVERRWARRLIFNPNHSTRRQGACEIPVSNSREFGADCQTYRIAGNITTPIALHWTS